MATNVNEGSQFIGWDFKHKIKGEEYNRILRDLVKPGIYSGLTMSIGLGNAITFTQGTAFLNTEFSSDDTRGIKVQFQSNFSKVIAQTNPIENEVVWMVYEYFEVIENWVEIKHDSVTNFLADITPNKVVIGDIVYVAAAATSIDYSRRTKGLFDVDNSYAIPDDQLIANVATGSKKFRFNATNISPASTRIVEVPDENIVLNGVPAWASGKYYAATSVRYYNGALYRCNTAHTSTAFAGDIANWDLMDSTAVVTTWITATAYNVGEIVVFNSKLYRATVTHTSGTFNTDAANWDLMSPSVNDWVAATAYKNNELVVKDGLLYQTNTAHVSSADFYTDAANWDLFAPKVLDWAGPNTVYKQDQLVVDGGVLYRAINSHLSSAAFATDVAQWEVVGGAGGGGGSGFSALVDSYNDSIYKYAAVTEFSSDGTHTGGNTLVDAGSTATAGTDKYTFDDPPAEYVGTAAFISPDFQNNPGIIDRASVALKWEGATAGKNDALSRIRVTRNGGLYWKEGYAELRDIQTVEPASVTAEFTATQDTDVAINITSQTKLGQSFQPTFTGIVDFVELYLRRVSTPGGRIRVLVTSGVSTPDTALVEAWSEWQNVDTALSTSYGYVAFPLIQKLKATSAVTKYIVLEIEDTAGYYYTASTSEVQWGSDASSPSYTAGQAFIYGGSWSGVTGSDHLFRVYARKIVGDPRSDVSAGEAVFDLEDHYKADRVLIDYPSTNGDGNQHFSNASNYQKLALRFSLDNGDYGIHLFEAYLQRTGAPGGKLSAYVYDDDGAGLPGALKATFDTIYAINQLSSSLAYVAFKFDPSALGLESGIDYWVSLEQTGYTYSAGVNELLWRRDAGHSYTPGKFAEYNGSVWAEIATTIPIFRVKGGYSDQTLLAAYDSVNTTTGVDLDAGAAREKIGQKFSLDTDAARKSVGLWLKRTGAVAGTVNVTICADSAGSPGTVLLTSDSKTVTDLSSAAFAEVLFTFEETYTFESGTSYWIVLNSDATYIADYVNSSKELEWLSDATTPVHPAGTSKTYAAAAWSAQTDVMVYSLYAYEAEVQAQVYGRTDNSELLGLGVWYLADNSLTTSVESVSRISLTDDMRDSGDIPSGLRDDEVLALVDGSTIISPYDMARSPGLVHIAPADLVGATHVDFISLNQGISFVNPRLQAYDRWRNYPDPIFVRQDVETIEIQSTGGANYCKVPMPDGTLRLVQHGARVSFAAAKNRYGGLGLDTGAEASNTEYYVYFVPRGNTDFADIVFSQTKPSGGGPSGYRFWKIGARAWNDGSSNLVYPFTPHIKLLNSTARGSTNTAVRRWTTVDTAYGADLTLTQSATLGDIITINRAGEYDCQLAAYVTLISGPVVMQIVKNSTATFAQEHTDMVVNVQAVGPGTLEFEATGSRVASLVVGDIVRSVSTTHNTGQGQFAVKWVGSDKLESL